MAESDLLFSDVTRKVIGAAMEVHCHLGCGFLESVYEEALAIEFDLCNIRYERQKSMDIFYKGRKTKQFVCDFLVENAVIVELKALRQLTAVEEAQLLNYLKATNMKVGLLINFGEVSLKYKRFVN